jgi:hypothetical protein
VQAKSPSPTHIPEETIHVPMTLRKRVLIPSSSLASIKGFVFPHPSIHDFLIFFQKKFSKKRKREREKTSYGKSSILTFFFLMNFGILDIPKPTHTT